MNEAQLAELKKALEEIQRGGSANAEAVKKLNDKIDALEKANAEQQKLHDAERKAREETQKELDKLRRLNLGRKSVSASQRQPGRVSIECAEWLGAAFIAGNARSGRLDLLPGHVREQLFERAKNILGIEQKAALTTTDVPLPIEYFSEVRELISEFGVARKKMQMFPIGMGTAKPPRFKTRPSFGSIAMSGSFGEKSPQIDFASLESHKIGGIVRVPREIDEQSIVPMGMFLAKYGAVEFARAEDTWGFLADGSGTYESVKGIDKIARDNTKTVVLASTKTKPSDAVLADFRSLRTKVNKAALSGQRSAYYMDTTWETQLPTFRTQAEPLVYQRLPDGTAILDGYPIIWTDVLQAFTTAAAADKTIAVFGALDFWWFGEHGSPRLDFSSDVYFTTDELGTRFIEEIDFDYQQLDVTGSLITAAS